MDGRGHGLMGGAQIEQEGKGWEHSSQLINSALREMTACLPSPPGVEHTPTPTVLTFSGWNLQAHPLARERARGTVSCRRVHAPLHVRPRHQLSSLCPLFLCALALHTAAFFVPPGATSSFFGIHSPFPTLSLLRSTIYNMCTQKPPHDYSEQLYGKYRDAFNSYITGKVRQSGVHAPQHAQQIQQLFLRLSCNGVVDVCIDTSTPHLRMQVLPSLLELRDEMLLRELYQRWNNHKLMVRWLSRFFNYLDRCVGIHTADEMCMTLKVP